MKRRFLQAAVMTSCVWLLTACGNSKQAAMENTVEDASTNVATDGGKNPMTVADNRDNVDMPVGMGRYVEKNVMDRGGKFASDIQRMADGTLVLFNASGKYLSKDNGDSWELQELDWLNAFTAENYIAQVSVSKEGMIAMAYYKSGESEETGNIVTYYQLVTPDGVQIPFDMGMSGDERGITDFCFTETGRLFAGVHNNAVYEISTTDGSSKKAFSLEEVPTYLTVCQKDILLCAGMDKVYLYDLKSGDFLEDAVLQDFIKENYTRVEGFGENRYNVYLFGGEENIVYLAGKKGLHRHVIGGSSVEQIIDGSSSSFGDPSHLIELAVMLDNQEFLALFSDNNVIKYTYDAEIPSVPNDRLIVYSLEENSTVRQAITVYQTANPDMQITYEIGMEDDSITREDALKKLSTGLLNGSGPDVLILDKMPYNSYMDKGVLMDIHDVAEGLQGENGLLTNLITPLYTNNRLYMLPAEFRLPMIAGHQEDIANTNDYQGIAEAVEAMRKKYPNTDLIEKSSETGVLKTFFMVCEPSWKLENGDLDQEKLKEFLEQSKRIYNAQMESLPQTVLDDYNEMNEYWLKEEGVSFEDSRYFNRLGSKSTSYICNDIQLMCGASNSIEDYAGILSTVRIKGFEDTQLRRMDGQSQNVYYPLTLAGINAATSNREKAVLFLQTLLGKEVQDLVYYGYPVLQSAFEGKLQPDLSRVEEDGAFSWLGGSTAEGKSFDFVVYWPEEAQLQQLRDYANQSNTPYLQDIVLEETVCKEGAKYLNGSQDIDTTVKAIMDNIAIYLME